MSAPLKLAGFAAALAALFGVAAAAGGALDPEPAREERGAASAGAGAGHGAAAGAPRMDGGAHAAAAVRGLAVADDGLRIALTGSPQLRRGAPARVAFRIVDRHGRAVRDFETTHERRLHLIVVRRDLTGFQHLHPTMAPDGTWSASLRLDAAGSYRLFADFQHDGAPTTLATDLRVDGAADLGDLPAPAAIATSEGGDAVTLSHDGAAEPAPAHAGEETALRFAIARGGQPVRVEPYLGASGHLVALREGDLAFLHVHPGGDGIAFETTFPTPGRYRLFLQYKAGGRVETVAFTQEVV